MSPAQRTVLYDGLCQLCSREIGLFKRRVTDGSLAFVDIADPAFDAAANGMDAVHVHKDMHVRDETTGRVLVGIEALAGMWECVPGFRGLATVVRWPVVNWFARVGYVAFAWVRPKFPRRRPACETGSCPVR